jgi:O-antigen/teichoic acid export membrane protein
MDQDAAPRRHPGADGAPPAAGPSASREVPTALAWSLVSKVLVSILAIASNVLIVRGLGDQAYGVYSIFLNIARFLAIVLGLGLAQGVLQYLPELRLRGDTRGARQLLGRALLWQLGGWGIVLLAAFLLRDWLSQIQKADLRTLLPIGTALLLFESLWSTLANVYTSVRRMAWLTIASVAQKAALVGLLILLARGGVTPIHVVYVVAGSFLLGIALLAPGMPRLLPAGPEVANGGMPASRLWRYAWPIVVGNLINQVLWRSSDTLFIGYYWNPTLVGYYNAAYNLAQMIIEFVPLAIWPVILSSLAEAHVRRSDDLRRGTQLYFRLIFVLVVPFSLTGMVLGGQAYLAMYGAAMAPGAGLCQALFGILMIGFFMTPLRMAMFVKERTLANTLVLVVGAVVNVALNVLLIPRHGIWGAAISVGVALALTSVVQYVVTRRALPWAGVPWACFGKVLLASSPVLPFWFVRGSLSRPLPLAGVLMGITIVQYLALRRLRVFEEEERELLRRSNLPLKPLLGWFLGPPRSAP